MAQCGSCSGTGKTSCSGCYGRGHNTRLTINYVAKTSTCLVCNGTRRMRCDFCRGTGKIGPDRSAPPVDPNKKFEDVLEGKWYGPNGDYYQFIKKKDREYKVKEFGAMGQFGEGSAKIKGKKVTMDLKNAFFGNFQLVMTLSGNNLSGIVQIMGMNVPMGFSRR